MGSEGPIRRLATMCFVVLLVGAIVGLAYASIVPLDDVLLPKWAVLSRFGIGAWNATFDIPNPGGRVMGSWTAYDGVGIPDLWIVNGSSVPAGACYHGGAIFVEINATIDLRLGPGVHTAYWSHCFIARQLVVTEAIHLVPGAAT